MASELTAVRTRCERVAARAYLVRNFYVNRAQPNRATALKATLPVFAELVRVALGYIADDEIRAKVPITSAKLAMMRIRQVAFDFSEAERGPLNPPHVARRAATAHRLARRPCEELYAAAPQGPPMTTCGPVSEEIVGRLAA